MYNSNNNCNYRQFGVDKLITSVMRYGKKKTMHCIPMAFKNGSATNIILIQAI